MCNFYLFFIIAIPGVKCVQYNPEVCGLAMKKGKLQIKSVELAVILLLMFSLGLSLEVLDKMLC